MKIIVLGAGLVGGPMAVDLAADPSFKVTSADVRAEPLDRLTGAGRIQTAQYDLADARQVRTLVSGYDIVLNALPGYLGFQTLQAVLEAGKPAVDIAFFPEDPFLLDELAKRRGVTAVVDCGVAPGMSNLLVGHVQSRLERIERVAIYVGGLPQTREWPFEYRTVFSLLDVIEEYTRPARFIEHGRLVTRPALSEREHIDFPEIGTLEAFNSDGLRTLIATIPAPHMKEKTLRYPGHAEKMELLRETGFFSKEPLSIGKVAVRPLDLTAALLREKWQLQPGSGDFTVMRVSVEGEAAGRTQRWTYQLLDRSDPHSGTLSMARTTGYTATSMVRLLASGIYRQPGITPPEFVGRDPRAVDFMLTELAKRGIHYHETIEPHG